MRDTGRQRPTCFLRAPSGTLRGTWITVGSFLGGSGGGGGGGGTSAADPSPAPCSAAWWTSPLIETAAIASTAGAAAGTWAWLLGASTSLAIPGGGSSSSIPGGLSGKNVSHKDQWVIECQSFL